MPYFLFTSRWECLTHKYFINWLCYFIPQSIKRVVKKLNVFWKSVGFGFIQNYKLRLRKRPKSRTNFWMWSRFWNVRNRGSAPSIPNYGRAKPTDKMVAPTFWARASATTGEAAQTRMMNALCTNRSWKRKWVKDWTEAAVCTEYHVGGFVWRITMFLFRTFLMEPVLLTKLAIKPPILFAPPLAVRIIT